MASHVHVLTTTHDQTRSRSPFDIHHTADKPSRIGNGKWCQIDKRQYSLGSSRRGMPRASHKVRRLIGRDLCDQSPAQRRGRSLGNMEEGATERMVQHCYTSCAAEPLETAQSLHDAGTELVARNRKIQVGDGQLVSTALTCQDCPSLAIAVLIFCLRFMDANTE